jgi:integrase
MEWSEITGDVWTIPAAKFKTKVKHSVHLTPTVMAALERRRGHHERWVFPSISMPDRPHAYPSRQFQRICKAAGVSGVTMHDLRRTLGSRLAARFPIPVVAKILGHKNISTTMSTYAVADDGDARAAMMALAAEQ